MSKLTFTCHITGVDGKTYAVSTTVARNWEDAQKWCDGIGGADLGMDICDADSIAEAEMMVAQLNNKN